MTRCGLMLVIVYVKEAWLGVVPRNINNIMKNTSSSGAYPELVDCGDYNDLPNPSTPWALWLASAAFGALSVICTIIATQPTENLLP